MTTTAAIAAKTVIVADDTEFVRDRFKSALQGAGHRALTAATAADLLAQLKTDARVDLILLDLRLPAGHGVEMIKQIREIDGGRLPILIFSGTIKNSVEVQELAALGVAGYVNEYGAVAHILPSLAPHLFPDHHNRRDSPRVVLGVPIAYRFGNTIAAALTRNLSRGGMAIRTTSPLERDIRVRVRFRVPGSSRDIEADARVAWTDRRVGMGLQFEHVDPDSARLVVDFVARHFFTNRRA